MDKITAIENKITEKYKLFGINKIRELTRLVFEISKRDKSDFNLLIDSVDCSGYNDVKNFLLQKRYPKSFGKVDKKAFYLPDIKINETEAADIQLKKFNPQKIFYTNDVVNSKLYNRIKSLFPHAEFEEIESLKAYIKNNKFSVSGYNRRKENLFLVNEKYDFFKKCPCTKNVKCCNYSILNIGFGCIFECTYCFLQGYQNVNGIILPCNLDKFLNRDIIKPLNNPMFFLPRVGSGEFTDSLVFDDITLFSENIVEFFKNNTDISFEFKTKSVNIDNLLKIGGKENIVVAWSVNADRMIKENEYCTPGLKERLEAAKKCVQAGYSIGFHFDPVIFYDDWKNGYSRTIEMIFDFIDEKYIKWISIGSLRMPFAIKKIIENRFYENAILNEELLLSYDSKLRYETFVRFEIYRHMFKEIKAKSKKTAVYLCMENEELWKAFQGD